MDTGYVTALEHEALPVGQGPRERSLSYEEAERLLAVGELRRGFCQRGYRSVKLSQYTGVVSLGGRVLEILPKVDDRMPAEQCRGVLLRLLRHSGVLPPSSHPPAGQHLASAPLLEVFIAAFLEAVTQIVRGGLLHQYREVEEDLRVVRGRIVTARQLGAHSNRPDRIACRFDDLTPDNRWNRLVKLGLDLVRPWIGGAELYSRWTELWAVFDEVDRSRADPRSLDRMVFDRHALRYRPAIEWVRWIVRLLSPSLRAGEAEAPALLFDTNVLFQSAVTAVLRRGAGVGIEVGPGDGERSLARIAGPDGRKAYALKPDLVVRRAGRVTAIGDTKWKRLRAGSRGGYLFPREEDLYQMQAYAAAYECRDLALIYPWHRGLESSRETCFEIPGPGGERASLRVMCVDVRSDSFTPVRGADASELGALLVARAAPAVV